MGPEAKLRLEWAKRDLKEARRKIAPGAARRELAATMREREKAAFMRLNEAPWRLAEAVQREYDEQTAADLERERKDMERRCHELQLASLQPVELIRVRVVTCSGAHGGSWTRRSRPATGFAGGQTAAGATGTSTFTWRPLPSQWTRRAACRSIAV